MFFLQSSTFCDLVSKNAFFRSASWIVEVIKELIAETSSGCVNFNFANVPIVEKSNAYSGIKIGFKRSLDKCPSKTANSPLFGQTTITESYTSEGILYNYNITEFKSGSSTKWVFKPPTICPKDSIKLTRGKIDVCVSFRFFPDSKKCQNQAMGVKLCQDSGDSGLTGPFSDKERELFGNKLSTYQSDYTHQNFWIDGKRVDGSSSYTFSDSSLSSTNGYGSVRGANDACHFLATKGNLIADLEKGLRDDDDSEESSEENIDDEDDGNNNNSFDPANTASYSSAVPSVPPPIPINSFSSPPVLSASPQPLINSHSSPSPTDEFQRLARLLEAENQKFSVISYRIGVRDSVTAETFTVCTGHTTSERSSTDRKNEKKKKTTKINFSIGWSFNGRKEGERQRKDGVQRARRQNV
ncbi:hypothetical protein L3Y34_002162 [Caenorhabditis briggsae]|uniref:Uncharacterized protein n=1 Tax=Caenorhabditis briggsae TaxID=6238 RepID=A0AAE9DE38_CAEBR|nr:hypothetical protein L3Y34_002162 [Caenorhabditis briggsae]